MIRAAEPAFDGSKIVDAGHGHGAHHDLANGGTQRRRGQGGLSESGNIANNGIEPVALSSSKKLRSGLHVLSALQQQGCRAALGHLLKPGKMSVLLHGVGHARSWTIGVLVFLVLVTITVPATQSSLNAPFIWDDLHLVRVHTPRQLAEAWTGTYDSDHVESYGFRPLTVYFEHFRALAFGESLAAHRLFLVVLFCLYLTLAAMLARWFLPTAFWSLVLGGWLGFFHISSVYHYVWITGGVHFLSGTLILAAILGLLQALSLGQARWLLASLLFSTLALLTREDSVTVYPLLLYFGVGFLWFGKDRYQPPSWNKLTLTLYAVLMIIVLAVYWYWRSVVVPQAQPVEIEPSGFWWAAARIAQNPGDLRDLIHPWLRYEVVIWSWRVWLGILAVLGILVLKGRQRRQILFWLGATLLAALPDLQTARSDTLLPAVVFWGVLLASVLAAIWNRSEGLLARLFVIAMALFAAAAPTYGSLVWTQEQRTNNLEIICFNAGSEYAKNLTIPAARRESVQRQLGVYGITSQADFERLFPRLLREAQVNGRFAANSRGLPFIPRFYFLSTPLQGSCIGSP